jgi:hypothetical protein
MLRTRFAKLAPLFGMALLLVFSGCSGSPRSQAKAADSVMNAILTTSGTSTTTATTPVGTPPSIPPVDSSNWKITQAQAVATASTYVPAEILSQARISVGIDGGGNLNNGETYSYWSIAFTNISVTQAELGWQGDSQTTLNPNAEGICNEIVIRIDPVTGDLVSRTAYFALPLGGPDTTSFYPSNDQTDIPINDVIFIWPAVSGASTTYQFALAQASANTPANEFANIDYTDTTLTNAEPCQETLQYNAVYWWEVRTVTLSATGAIASAGPWSLQTFTTMPQPTPTTPWRQYIGTNAVVTTTFVTTTVISTYTDTIFTSVSSKNARTTKPFLFWSSVAVDTVLILGVIVLIVRKR